ncbi:glycosyltransferase 87 family protein [Catellatospora sp. KI3]|uniref:glycosyltransferase family 87 protein n=1 Tax=Catellatospora sp. KI3 TaxID=3041620 RepID=UPI002482A53A|nr:glycosyltransferase 87 family protein [Catellatospora sp. KI3]MDI1461682.1 glycosyltransferase 87 family protein [Catellatospora sp. KI3]
MSDVREHVVSPSVEDPFVHGLSQAIGGPRGEHAVPQTPDRGGRFWTAARIVLALTCLMLALHWVQKSPCKDGAWADYKQYTHFCYTDVLALYYAEHLNEGAVPYVDYPVEYPVLTGAFMGAIGLPVHAFGSKNDINQAEYFYNANALVLSVFAVATVAMILSLRRRRPWDAAMFALSPALLVTATVNWDLLAIVLAVAGVWFWAKRYPVAAGAMLGLGMAAKLWPAFLFLPIAVLALRPVRELPGEPGNSLTDFWRRRELGPALLAVASGAVAWAVVNVPVMLTHYDNWKRFLDLNTERGIDWGTSWYVGRHFDPTGATVWDNVPLVTNVSLALFAVCCVGIAALGLLAKTPPRVAQLAFLVVALFLITNKVWSQQFTLWMLPLLVLARPKWISFLVWQVAEVIYFLAFYGELMTASGKPVFPEGVFVLAASIRLIAVLALVVLVVRDILRPELDVVRRTYADSDTPDPDGGPLNPDSAPAVVTDAVPGRLATA